MKRVHFKRKLPKYKILDIHRGRTHTSYIRRTRSNHLNCLVSSAAITTSPQESETVTASTSSSESVKSASKKQKLLEGWERIRHDLLMVRVEEMCPASSICCMCDVSTDAIIHCSDCGPMAYYCSDCCTRIHTVVSNHKPMRWLASDCLYVPFILKRVLRRSDNHDCGQLTTSDIVIVDSEGKQHECIITLCRCEDAALTFLRCNLWPATPVNPKLGIDLKFMEILSVLQLECHLPAKSFCQALSHIQLYTCSVGPSPKNIYRAVVGDCLTEYNFHRSSLKSRFNITESTLGRECPICQKDPPVISMDGNFGLVHKMSSGEGHGQQSSRHRHLFFHEHSDLKTFLNSYAADQKSKTTECSNFQAGNLVRSKIKNKKLDVTGVFGSVCKHDIPLVFLDMFHGERLGYAVYILTKVLQHRSNELTVMYDIACTLHKHLQKNNMEDILQKCQFAVPVFHSFAHNLACQLVYGQRYADGTGLTDGEGIERLWSYLRGFKKITKEMTVNNREDLLTEAMLHHTEKVTRNIASKLTDKMEKAERMVAECKTTLQLTTENRDGLMSAILSLFNKWKSDAEKKVKKDMGLTNDELYVEALQKMNNTRSSMNQLEIEEDTANAERELKRLEKECRRLKNKCTNTDFSEDRLVSLAESGKKKRKMSSLRKLRSMATERQYLSTLMKKYADGQGIGLRVSRQYTTNSQKIKTELATLNIYDPQVQFSDVTSPTAGVYFELDSRAISNEQQKSIEVMFLLQHAEQEMASVQAEFEMLVQFLHVQSETLLGEISFLMEQSDRMSRGKIMFLYHHHLFLENMWETCQPLINKFGADDHFPKFVRNKVESELQSDMALKNSSLSSELLSEILEEINEFENEDTDDVMVAAADDDDDEEEEEDDDEEVQDEDDNESSFEV